jgi:cytochrome P450
MNYPTMWFKEALRYNSTVAAISRELSRDLQVGDHILPKCCLVDIFLYQINRYPDVWDKPHEFNPERFNEHASDRVA